MIVFLFMLGILNKKWFALLFIATIAIVFFLLVKIHSPENIPFFEITHLKTPFSENLEIKQTSFKSKNCNILDYGASFNNQKANTQAISNAIDDCFKAGGGTVIIPEGQWLTGPIKLKSNINLNIQENAEIIFSTNLEDYLPVVFSRFEGVEYYNYSAPIYANNCTNIAITGKGKINGQAEKLWWKMDESTYVKKLYYMGRNNTPVSERIFGTPKAKIRPSFVEFINCDTILIEDIQLIHGPLWSVHFIYSQNITVKDIEIDTGKEQDTDGIVIDSSNNVLVENANLTTGDDAIVIKSGRDQDGKRVNRASKDIIIRNCQIQKANAGIAIGSEISGGVRDVFVQNLSIKKSDFAIRLKSALGRGNSVENIWIEEVFATKTKIDGIQIDSLYERPFKENYTESTTFKNINISNVQIERAEKSSLSIRGSKEKFIENVSLKNIQMKSNSGPKITRTNNLQIDNLQIFTTKNPVFSLKDTIDTKITNYTCPSENEECFHISGEKSKNIKIIDTNLSEKNVVFDDNVDKEVLIK